jgi:hypothetical protein
MNDMSSDYTSQATVETSTSALFAGISNETAMCDGIAADIKCDLEIVSGSTFKTLETYAVIGGRLIRIKAILGSSGVFGSYVESKLGMKKAWRARVMKVSAEWDKICKAIEWAKSEGRMDRAVYSVDRALALLREWKQSQGAIARKPRRKTVPLKQQNAVLKQEVSNFRQQHETVETELAQAKARIRELEGDLEWSGKDINPAPVATECEELVSDGQTEEPQ